MVKRVMSISLDSELIEWINENSLEFFRNKSHLVEEAVKEMRKMEETE